MSRLSQRIAAGVYQIALGGVNAFLIDVDADGVATAARAAGGGIAPGGLVLVGAGVARSAARIGAAIRDLGRAPGDVRAPAPRPHGRARARRHRLGRALVAPVTGRTFVLDGGLKG